MDVLNTWWSLIPPAIAIILAFVTKEVFSSLFIGILFGAILLNGLNIAGIIESVFLDGFINSISNSWNASIMIFLVVLGCMAVLVKKSGASIAFGKWAEKHVKSKTGATVATILLGCLLCIDDAFNCLTVSSVMYPITDKHNISRAKLAYLIDATAAPICIIAPISSWSAAVASSADGVNGFSIFLRAIPYNYYALLTIAMMFIMALMKLDYGPMKKAEEVIQNKKPIEQVVKENSNGKIIHLILPIIVLIIACVMGIVYTGGFFNGVDFISAFGKSNAARGLVFGSFITLIFTVIFCVITKALSFKDCMEAIPEGFKIMVPAILILVFAWALKNTTTALGSDIFVSNVVSNFADHNTFMSLIPAVVYLVACFISFATGTSWGTFGILIPIVVRVFGADESNILMIISISACMAGAVCGDHCSPISDTTIMASAGAQVEHLEHVQTQLPYAITAALISLVAFIFAGFVRNVYISLLFAFVFEIVVLTIIKMIDKKTSR